MSATKFLVIRYAQQLWEYRQTVLPTATPEKINADMQAYLFDMIRFCATHGRIELVGPTVWSGIVSMCFWLIQSIVSNGGYEIAELFAEQVPEALASEVSLGEKLMLYDMLQSLYFLGAPDWRKLPPFDTRVVQPFSHWVRATARSSPRLRPLAPDARLKVGYLCNYPIRAGGGGDRLGAPLYLSLMFDHRAQFDHEVIAYCHGGYDPAWRTAVEDVGIEVRPLPFVGYTGSGDLGFPQSLERVLQDGLDVLITDDNLALPLYLFENRVAPIQVYAAMAMPRWAIEQLDYVIAGQVGPEVCPQLPIERRILGRFGYSRRFLDRPAAPAALAALRQQFPPNHRVGGTFGRFVKFGPVFLDTVGRILDENPNFTMVIAGNGDATLVEAFVSASPHRDRILFIPHYVDIFTYGRAIDFLLDTFPFIGGNTGREIQYFGKPVLGVRTDEFAQLFVESRDVELLATDADDYVRLAGRLIHEPDFLAARSAAARAIGERETSELHSAAMLRDLLTRATTASGSI
jgi:hypothetical protein